MPEIGPNGANGEAALHERAALPMECRGGAPRQPQDGHLGPISAAHQRPGEGIPREDSQQVPADSSTFQQVAANAAGSAGYNRFQQIPQVLASSAGTSRTQQSKQCRAGFSALQQDPENPSRTRKAQHIPAGPNRSKFTAPIRG